jgi:hypothetical protein
MSSLPKFSELADYNKADSDERGRELDVDGAFIENDIYSLDGELNIVALRKTLDEKLKLTYQPTEGFDIIRETLGVIAIKLQEDYKEFLGEFRDFPSYARLQPSSMRKFAKDASKSLANIRMSALKASYPLHFKTLMGDMGNLTENANIPKDAWSRHPANTLTKKLKSKHN